MDRNIEIQTVSEETMRFMRGKYNLDEIHGKYYDSDCLKFRRCQTSQLMRSPVDN